MMSRSFPCRSSSLSTEVVAVVGQKSYACLPGESTRAEKGLTGRWADALLRNPAQGTVSAVSGMDLASQLTHQSLLQCSCRTPCAGARAACVPPRQRQRSAHNGCLRCVCNESRSDSSAIGVVPPRATAVGIHPPLSRGSLRAATSAAQAPTATSSVPASADSCTQTRDVEFYPGRLTSHLLADQAPPFPPQAVGTGTIVGEVGSLAVLDGPEDSARPPRESSAGVRGQRPTCVKAPVDGHLQPFPMSSPFHRGGGGSIHGNWSLDGGCGGPLASAATPHSLPGNYAPSSMFQSLAEATPTTHSSSDVPRATLSHHSVTARGEEGNSPVQRQDVTPMTRACDARTDIPPTSQPGELLSTEGGTGQFSYHSQVAAHNDGDGDMLGFSSPSAATAPSQGSLLPSARSTFVVGETSPCVQSALPSAARDFPQQQQHALYLGECSMNQGMHSKFYFCSPSSSETAQLTCTPGGLSTSRSVTAYSTAPRRGHSAVTVGTGQRTSMGSAAPLASPESLSPNITGVYTSPPTSAPQASLSSCAQRFSSFRASDSKRQGTQARIVTADTPSVRVHVLHQEHPSRVANGIYGVRRNGTHDSALPPSSQSSKNSPPSTFNDDQTTCFGVTRAAVAAAREQRGSVVVSLTTAPVAEAGPSSVMPRVVGDPSGLALGKQLLCASKGELAQMLLELSSCNPDASRFIRAKAFLFSFRHKQSDEVAGARDIYSAGAPTMTAFDAAAASHPNGGPYKRRGGSSNGVTSEAVNMSGCECPGERPVVLPQPVAVAASLATVAATHGPVIARCIFPAGVADEEDGDGNGCVAEHRASDRVVAKGAVQVKVSQRHTCPEDRTFSTELHPCLYWYGACRNTTSCMFVSLPRNICLNWIRGSCLADAECSGVHRLPSPCSPEVCDIYRLNHGLLRRDAHTAPRAHGRSVLSLPGKCTSQTRVKLASGGHRVETSARCEAGVFHAAAAAKRCAGRVVGRGLSAGASEGLSVDEVEVHTPTNQRIRKDTFPGDSSRARRLSKVRGSESRTSAMSMLERSDHSTTMKGDGGGLWDASDAVTAAEVTGAVDQEVLKYTGGILGADAGASSSSSALVLCANAPQRRWMSGMAPPDGSSRCSTAEGTSSCANSTIRCLGPHFDRAETPGANCDSGHPGSSLASLAVQQSLPDTKSIKSICNIKASVPADPMWSLGDDLLAGSFSDAAGALAEMDSECDFFAPSSGTRTRIHSPVCGGE